MRLWQYIYHSCCPVLNWWARQETLLHYITKIKFLLPMLSRMVCGILEQNIDVLIVQVHAIFCIYDTPVKTFREKKKNKLLVHQKIWYADDKMKQFVDMMTWRELPTCKHSLCFAIINIQFFMRSLPVISLSIANVISATSCYNIAIGLLNCTPIQIKCVCADALTTKAQQGAALLP